MTMVFSTPDSNLLKAVKPGDKVKFDAEQINGQLVLTKIEPAKQPAVNLKAPEGTRHERAVSYRNSWDGNSCLLWAHSVFAWCCDGGPGSQASCSSSRTRECAPAISAADSRRRVLNSLLGNLKIVDHDDILALEGRGEASS